ncbi:MAG TPA: hypothetical protein VKA46_27460 [Gemmataceae bacterium]|nr:hypothetical protein [Gemmataceae bacterium]
MSQVVCVVEADEKKVFFTWYEGARRVHALSADRLASGPVPDRGAQVP